MFRKIGRRKLVPYYDRAEIEDGAIAGRGLEICWLKNQTDLLFTQIQGSARVRLEDGSTIRINYDAHNGYPYTAVGRILIDRGIIPKEQMSMQRIREWMDQNPDGAKELRRQNRSYVFFREVQLSDKDEAVGAQGVPLTPGRSIAVDKALHVYGTPFFIEGELPIESEQSKTPFRRLMVAQDTGSAITGPARADIYFGAGADAGRVSGRFRHNMRFVILVPKSLDPVGAGPQDAAAGSAAVGENRKAVSASRSVEGSAQRPEDRLRSRRRLRCRAAAAVASRRADCSCRDRCRCRRRVRIIKPNRASGRRTVTISITIAAADETSAVMIPELPPPPRRKRSLSEEERALWESVAKQTKPLRKSLAPQSRRLVRRMRKRPSRQSRGFAETASVQPKFRAHQSRCRRAPPLAPLGRRERSHLVARPKRNRSPARPARHDADARAPRAVGFSAARP